jgi:6-phosphogluconate dehydrogenase
MELAMIGLGRMGASMVTRLVRGGHRVVVFDRDPAAVTRSIETGAEGTDSMPSIPGRLARPRVVWLMIPAGKPVEDACRTLAEHLEKDDIVIDGGNSNYQSSMERASFLRQKHIHFVDVGTSGGIWGLREGYCLMIGGDSDVVERLRPVFETLAPAPDRGWARVGPAGAGHFVKMVHNGIEYGLMQAYAEGFAVMKAKEDFDFDLPRIADLWRNGSVVRSWLLDLTAEALAENPDLKGIEPYVQDSGEGRWMVAEAIAQDIPAPVITLALLQRLRSRDAESFSDRMLAIMRRKFGGHDIKGTARY